MAEGEGHSPVTTASDEDFQSFDETDENHMPTPSTPTIAQPSISRSTEIRYFPVRTFVASPQRKLLAEGLRPNSQEL